MHTYKQAGISHKAQQAFTLIELAVTLLVGAIILAAAIPSMTTTLHRSRITATVSQLHVSLNLARGEAVKRSNQVMVCPSADGSSCRNDGDWSDGWVIFDNDDENDTLASAEIIRLVDSGSINDRIDIQVSNNMAGFVKFHASGRATGNGGNTAEFRICHADSSAGSKAINVSALGRVAAKDRTQTDCDASS